MLEIICRFSSVGQSSALVKQRSSVRIRQPAPESPALRRLASRRDKTSVRSLRFLFSLPPGHSSGRVKQKIGPCHPIDKTPDRVTTQVGARGKVAGTDMRVFSWERTQPSKLMERVRIPSPAPVNRAVSSVGRAARLHRVGREFETLTAHQG